MTHEKITLDQLESFLLMTISQNVSLLLLAGTAALYFLYITGQPKGIALPLRETEKK